MARGRSPARKGLTCRKRSKNQRVIMASSVPSAFMDVEAGIEGRDSDRNRGVKMKPIGSE